MAKYVFPTRCLFIGAMQIGISDMRCVAFRTFGVIYVKRNPKKQGGRDYRRMLASVFYVSDTLYSSADDEE